MNKALALAAATSAIAAGIFAGSADAAGVNRIWVSGHGVDQAGCGAPTAPCRSLQYAHDNIASGGEIDILDPAGYGAVTISKAVSIVNDGVGTAGVQASSGEAITIDAGTAAVVLRGLDIEGVGAADGVHFVAGRSLSIEDSTINGFAEFGIRFEPMTSGYLYVSDTRVTNTINSGIYVHPLIASGSATVQVTLAHVEVVHTYAGIYVDGTNAAPAATIDAAVTASVLGSNTYGIVSRTGASNASDFILVRDSTLAGNLTGVGAYGGGATVDLTHSALTGNATAFDITAPGAIGSYGDNAVDGNGGLGQTPAAVAFH
jgi:hypothetical protein